MIDANELSRKCIEKPESIDALLKDLPMPSKELVLRQIAYIIAARGAKYKSYIALSDEELAAQKKVREIELLRKEEVLQVDAPQNTAGTRYFSIGAIKYPQLRCLVEYDFSLLPNIDRGKDVIDAGAFIGDSAVVLSRIYGFSGQIHAFEPISKNYAKLCKTIALNGTKNITPVKLGLGSEKGKAEISLADAGSSILYGDKNGEQETIKITTIDAYVSECGLSIGLIKVDVEGFERELLKGALETIKTQRPSLIISIYHNAADYLYIKPELEAYSKLHNLGYSFAIAKEANGSIVQETCLYCLARR